MHTTNINGSLVLIQEVSAAEREQHGILKAKVKNLVAQTPTNMELIDAIQRLGIGYHFVNEIDESLKQIHTQISKGKDDDDIRVIALHFRLLRMIGYRTSCGVFKKFTDKEGNFKESLVNDIEGVLSLYEASHYGVNGEGIMDKALEFSLSHLESLSTTTNSLYKEALGTPISKTLNRLGAKKFISVYQQDELHNSALLHFAKLDFNMTQKMYQRELSYLSRWWEDLDFANRLPLERRERLVECYFWIVGIIFEPQYEMTRIFLTKIGIIFSAADDIYDNYGTLDELQRFTHAIKSWDIKAADKLPAYLRIYYEAILGVFAEMEDKIGLQAASKSVHHLLEAYLKEAEWRYTNYFPTLDEYVKVGLPSANTMMVVTCSLVGTQDCITKSDFDWITNYPHTLQISDLIARFMNDLVGYGKEQKITLVDCYMKEHECSEKEAFREISKQVKKAWKHLNDAWMEPRATKAKILERILNYCRVVYFTYYSGDEYTSPDTRIKNAIKSVLVDPIN